MSRLCFPTQIPDCIVTKLTWVQIPLKHLIQNIYKNYAYKKQARKCKSWSLSTATIYVLIRFSFYILEQLYFYSNIVRNSCVNNPGFTK
jgi:hypothetical protein